MKKAVYFLVLVVIGAACSTEPRFVLKANIEGSDSITFVLQKRENGKIINIDSALSVKGSFTMKGYIDYPQQVQLLAQNTRYRNLLFLENAKMTITGKLDSLFAAKVTGSKTQDDYKSFIELNKPLNDQYQELVKTFQLARVKNDTAEMSKIRKEALEIEKQMTAVQKDFVKNNPSSYFTPTLIASLSGEMTPVELEEMIAPLDTNVAKVEIIQSLKERIAGLKAVSIGQKAPDFTLNDVDGNPVSLYSKVGAKLLLIDFWAGWCNPCRNENPNVVKVYNAYHKKGFDIIGVSLDQSKDEWVKAIADDKLTWTHVSDLQYWNNAAARKYQVQFIPANFLLDETGTIIARDLHGEDLLNKVKEVLDK